MKRKKHAVFKVFISKLKSENVLSDNCSFIEKIVSKSRDLVEKNNIAIPIKKPKSPILLTTKAFIAAEFAVSFLYQKPISK